jgi:hypothetical protein
MPISILVCHHPVLGSAPIGGACGALTGLVLGKLLQMWTLSGPSTERGSKSKARKNKEGRAC